jgi:SM-20-related protein
MSAFRLNPDIDARALSRGLEPTGRLHVPDLLTEDAASRMGETLTAERSWNRVVTLRSGSFIAPLLDDEPVEEVHRRWLADAHLDGAQTAMQYVHDSRRLSSERQFGLGRDDVLTDLEAWLNGPEVIGFMRALTGDDRIAACDAQATRFLPGHVLTVHNDRDRDQRRLYAFVMNFTRPWRADWGGLLLFYGADGHVEQGFTPGFNTLNLFRVPQAHAVSQVASFAQGPRLAISGWFTT